MDLVEVDLAAFTPAHKDRRTDHCQGLGPQPKCPF